MESVPSRDWTSSSPVFLKGDCCLIQVHRLCPAPTSTVESDTEREQQWRERSNMLTDTTSQNMSARVNSSFSWRWNKHKCKNSNKMWQEKLHLGGELPWLRWINVTFISGPVYTTTFKKKYFPCIFQKNVTRSSTDQRKQTANVSWYPSVDVEVGWLSVVCTASSWTQRWCDRHFEMYSDQSFRATVREKKKIRFREKTCKFMRIMS